MLASDHKNTVFSEVRKDGRQNVVYTAYGDSAATGSIGYNGERRETQTGWYLLGNGYRAYNPGLMRFHSPDSLSPFGEGGLNAYMYCLGNPIEFKDPTGHVIFGLGWAAKLLSRLGKVFSKGVPKTTASVSPRNSLISLDSNLFSYEPSSTPVTKVTKVTKATKATELSKQKGPVDGNIKNGFWADQRNGVFRPSLQPPKKPSTVLSGSRPSQRAMLDDALRDPPSGGKLFLNRFNNPLFRPDLVASKVRRGGISQQEEAAASLW